MKVIIIEDERLTAEDLSQTILQADTDIEIVAILKSVNEGRRYFKNNPPPDIIFSDIELGDGLSFEILDNLNTPVIFCTAYDEYALNAFKANGIDYILKPFSLATVAAALQKFKNLTQVRRDEISRQYESIKNLFSDTKTAQVTALLVNFKDKILPIKIEDIALFCLENDVVYLMTFEHISYFPNKSLDELERIVGDHFFRTNRQYLVNRKAVLNVSSHLSRKLSVSVSIPVKESLTVSKEKSSMFLKWLAGGPF
ncbi:two component transcriptional regulator, LytTR family [Chitinophaga sp. CF118]|uniref:LytR/AlgR family response regulator transcription factor n=1 Tax=Chitinophaga sp. CF118 TaxID=1884367 RepID=UPI0008F4296D|nr:LytTR family DNA-binding domain-containing protein [Chitinophaga sp. CF118]SFD23886.1 two component transcriptional regulator, LytTR family [Chitinophaga sp. CF118]